METKKLIQALGFKPKENTSNTYHKKYSECNNYEIEVDFDKKKIDFGKIIKSESKTTQNFSQAENWVVLECVDRILEKGYQPKDITLEKTWKTGHGTSGRLDILVTQEKSTYLMIECKTWGTEFDKEFKNLEKNGGQLFTYFQQDNNAEVLMLYASKLDGKEILYKNEIVKIEEHYRQAGNVEDVYDRWNKISNSNGVFEDWVKPYLFENKKLTKKDLKPLNEEDSQKIFYEFLSILRKHSVSDKPNAFNKIFNLFLAKIFDEKKRDSKELEFQWKEHKDSPVEFQIRLINLYKSGMYDFLKKEVAGITDDMFNYSDKNDLENKKKNILIFNKVFDIKEVFDNDSFDDNQVVLKEVVQLLQNFQIRYPRKQQHLSDFFERLLTTGLKQEAGQFFTPPPITRFIIKSLPISKYIKEQLNKRTPELPAVIDYSVGSGHFLTEVMEEYQRVIEDDIDTSKLETDDAETFVNAWRINKYDWASKYVYGIEKDYRLVKVAKVGCYFYGDGLAQVIHGDGLDSFKHSKSYRGLLKKNVEKPQFSFIVSNPPYSVSSFKGDIKNINVKDDFKLYDSLTDRSSEIECLFVERTKQLLKTDGIASIILPSSILSNTGIYTEAREIILKHFDIIAIAELGSGTFMATGTNTVTLFLKRRKDEILLKIEEALDKFFNNLQDVTINGIEKPISKYISHVWEDVKFNDYKTLLQKTPNKTIEEHEIYKTYRSKKLNWTKVLELEKEKLFYFILTYNQKLVIVKTGQKKEEKQFLGFEFSNRRGSEGIHPIQRGKKIDDCTQLYDSTIFDNPEKASTYIYRAFTENRFDLDIPEKLQKNISYQNLVDMIAFDRIDFEKTISLSIKKKVKSKWPIVKLESICDVRDGTHESPTFVNDGFPLITSKNITSNYIDFSNVKNISKKDFDDINKRSLVEKGDILYAMIGTIGFPVIVKTNKQFAIKNVALFKFDKTKKLSNVYLKELLNYHIIKNQINYESKGSNRKFVSLSILRNLKIPLPPKEVQKKIVSEIEILEKEENKIVEKVNSNKLKIDDTINTLFSNNGTVKLKDKIKINTESQNPKTTYKDATFTYVDIESMQNGKGEISFDKEVVGNNAPSRARRIAKNDSVIISTVRPYLKGFAYIENAPKDTLFSTGFAILKSKKDTEYITKLVYYYFMYSSNLMRQMEAKMPKASYPSINKTDIELLKIPLIDIKEQAKVTKLIDKIEKENTVLKNKISTIPQRKEEILKKYLE
ncbi:N-6 DNA methylase [uncultured Lacinutrix sp.]|uniref:N-6 DNA methylase n=1 Tax=uncultured Lacinutrix sp. TaxID=574032 RepID=UPI00261F27CD|nr:N-6 DNA methylase [uncultured Lacinutrix sp.]